MYESDSQNPETNEARQSASSASQLARPEDVLPSLLHILPLSTRPLFPGQVFPLVLEREHWQATLEAVVKAEQKVVGLIAIRGDEAEQAQPDDFWSMGTVCRIFEAKQTDEHIQLLVEGLQRFEIERWVSQEKPYVVQAKYLPEIAVPEGEPHKAYTMAIINTIKELLPLNPLYREELKYFIGRFGPDRPSQLADFSASLTSARKEELQDILQTIDLKLRLEKVLLLLKKEVELAHAQNKINKEVEERLSEHQREFFLREQLKAIQKELGIAKDDRTAEIERFQQRLESLTLTEEAERRIGEELDKLAVLETGSPEYTVTRNYLDWLTRLPWGVYSQDNLDLKHARTILDAHHDGLGDVKDRIIEFLAVGSMKGQVAGSIILLVGPPGVGKTSIGRSIAASLGRKFYRFSVGGMRDEAEIKGHRRTYIGAMPGKFLQAMKEVEIANPVIMLDEIDKVGASFQGDPAAALLEALDPEQNVDFLDHYVDVRFDLSRVLFICTANQLDTIPAPLLDRMEIIRLSGYITDEKLAIAEHHLIPRVLDKAGLKTSQVKISHSALERIIEGYAREAGVRNLEKRIGTIARKAVVQILGGAKTPIMIGPRNLESFLGKPVFVKERPIAGVGVVTGLAWTAMGGATLSIEATRVHEHTRGFKLTGQLGNVMKESAEIAYSYISSHCDQYGAKADYFEKAYVHLHVPAGATPKDGPSAGVTMATALLSLARNRKIARPLAMTGELTLTGQVLPVGGIKEKVIAARRIGIGELILPHANLGDFEELPAHLRDGLTVHFAKHFRDVATLTFPDTAK